MNKRLKRTLATLTSACLLVSSLTLSAFAVQPNADTLGIKQMKSLAEADISVTQTGGSTTVPFIQERTYNTELTGDVLLNAGVSSVVTFDVTADLGTYDIGDAFESSFSLLYGYNSSKRTDNLHYVYQVGDLVITAARIPNETNATVNLNFTATYNGVPLETRTTGNTTFGVTNGNTFASADRTANVTEFCNYLLDNNINTHWIVYENGQPVVNFWYAFELPVSVKMRDGIVTISALGTKTVEFVLPESANFSNSKVSLTEQTLGGSQVVGLCNWACSYEEKNTVDDIGVAYKNEAFKPLNEANISVVRTSGTSNIPYITNRTYYNTELTGDMMLAAVASSTKAHLATADFGTYDIGPWFDCDFNLLYNYNYTRTDNLHYTLQIGGLVITAARIVGETNATVNLDFSATYNGVPLEVRNGGNTIFGVTQGNTISSDDRLANVTEFYNYLVANGIGTDWLIVENGQPRTNFWYCFEMPLSVKLRNGVVSVVSKNTKSVDFILPEDASFDNAQVKVSEETFAGNQIVGICNWSGTYAAPVKSEPHFSGANLSVGEGIGINFYVPDALLDEYDSTYATVDYDVDGDGTNDTVRIDPVDYTSGADYQKYTFNELTPDRMADNVYVTLYGVKDGQATQLAGPTGYSVRQYAINAYSATLDPQSPLYGDTNLRRLLADMLTYGEAARLHAGSGTSILTGLSWVDAYKTSGAVANQASCDVESITYLANTVTASTAHFNWSEVSVDLRANPRLVYTFAPTANAGSLSDYAIVIEKDGTSAEFALPAAQNGVCTFSYDGLSAADMAKTVRAYIIDANGNTVSAAFDYSVESFAYNCFEQTNGGTQASASVSLSLYNLSQALIRYGISAKTYVDNANLGQLVAYPEYDARINRDYAYSVSVTKGNRTVDLVTYNHTDSVAASPRTVNGDMFRRFCEFAFSGSQVRVDVTVHSDFDSYTVMPSAKEFTTTRNGNVISVYLDEPEYFLIKLDDKDDSILAVFADEPETDVPSKDEPNVTVIEGWYEPVDADGNRLTVMNVDKAGTTLYLAPGSVLNARLHITAPSVTVKGRGIILDPYSDIYNNNTTESTTTDTQYFVHAAADNIVIDGIKLIDARDYNLVVNGSGVTATNVKILSSEMCTDGISQWEGNNNLFRHFFIYNADNGLVISGGENILFEDITVGTICCAVFPQSSVGTSTINDLYVFRADEGLLRNCYNYNNLQRTFSMTLTNVSAVDCDHFPFIFHGFGMGTAAKSITFNNLAVPVATGSNTLGQGDGSTIRIENVTGKIDTSNYTLTFNGLSVGGQAITDPAQLPTNMTDGNTIVVTGNGAQNMPVLPETNNGSVVAAGKIYIGNRNLFTEAKAVQQGGVWYVPAEAVCAALNRAVPASTTLINGTTYISLANLVSSGVTTSAAYNAATGRINIAPPASNVGNLLDWFTTDTHSRWSEYTPYEVDMIYLAEYDQNSFKVVRSSSGGVSAGASYNLTEQVQQYGAGTYTLTFDLRSTKASAVSIKMDAQTGLKSNAKYSSAGTTSAEWSTVTFTYQLNAAVTNGVDPNNITNASLILYATAANAEFEFRNASLTFTPAS